MYDIIYSILCHEHPDSVVDMIKNIFYYNKDISCCIIINCNHTMFAALKDIQTEHIKLSDIPFNKRIYTYDILKGHIINFNYCKKYSFESTYFIPLASNCMFHKPVTLKIIENKLIESPAFDTSIADPSKKYTDWNWPPFFANITIVNIMNNNNIVNFDGYQHEGFIIPYNIMNSIVEFISRNHIEESIRRETVFEEILLGTIYAHITKKRGCSICKVFWSAPNYTPTIKQITETEEPCVKRVNRGYNDLVRVWLRTQAGKYV